MTSSNQPPSGLPTVTPFTRLKEFFATVLVALGELADVMALWSWWRVLGLSLLIFIAGAIFDDFLFKPVASTKVVTVDSGEPSTAGSKKPATDELNLPEDIQSGKVSIRIDKDGVKIDRTDKDGAGTATTTNTPAPVTPTSPDQAKAPDVPKPPAPPKTERAKVTSGTDASSVLDTDQQIARAVADALRDANSGKRSKIKIKIDTDVDSDGPSPFKFIAFLMCLTMWISKIVGGSRMREKAATVRANVATANLQSQSLERQIAEAKLLRMQAQVEPHFLFNTLAALERLIETNPTRALAMSQALSQWLRALLPQMKEGQSTLGQEVTLVQNYLQLMQMRMGERLAYFIDVPENLRSEALPSMLLQPLVENSIKHGLEPKRVGGEVRIKARRLNEFVELTVEDTGIGFSSNPGSGNGLTNLRERLELIYGGRAMVSVIPRGTFGANSAGNSNQSGDEGLTGTVITIKIPVSKK